MRTTKTNSLTVDSAATSVPPIGDSFMYKATSSYNHGHERIFLFGKELILYKKLI